MRGHYKHIALTTASRYGQADRLLNVLQRLPFDVIDDPSEVVDRRIREFVFEPRSEGKILLPLFPGYQINQGVQAILARAFHTRGVDTIQLRCDETLPICCKENVTKNREATRSVCEFTTSQVCEAFGIDSTSPQEVLPTDYSPPVPDLADGREDISYKGVDVSELCFANTREYFKKYNLDLRDEQERKVFDRYCSAAITLIDAYELILDEHDITAVVAFEDHYVHGGTALALASTRSIPAYSVDLGYQNETLVFGQWNNRNSLPFFTDDEILTSVMSDDLSEDQESKIDDLMRGRIDGVTTRFQYSAQTDKSVQVSDGVTTIGMFTNLSWDAASEAHDVLFSDMFEWISATVEEVRGRPGVQLIIKTHPAEAVRTTCEPVGEWIATNLDPLPDNVTVLPPGTDINTYQLAADLDLATVYSSMVGLEMAYLGLPVIVAGDPHYRDLGITTDPHTPNEYLQFINDPSLVHVDPDRAKRYAHFFFYNKHVPFPFVRSDSDGENIKILPVSYREISPGSEPTDLITESILSGGSVLSE